MLVTRKILATYQIDDPLVEYQKRLEIKFKSSLNANIISAPEKIKKQINVVLINKYISQKWRGPPPTPLSLRPYVLY